MKSDITNDTYNSQGVECPFCGHVSNYSYELGDGGEGCGETDCGRCEKTFIWERVINVNYIGRERKIST